MSFIFEFSTNILCFFVQMCIYLFRVGVLFAFFTSNVVYDDVLSGCNRLEGVKFWLKANFLRR
ncbi:MAG: hypothetical protein K0S31_578 [Sphingobacterium multivorum]|jgi:hypothetical protein|nr:hypothetical protein [Sphingobacterium multivorum]